MAMKITIRLYHGRDDDLIKWVEAQNGHHGAKAHALREALRRGIKGSSPSPRQPAPLDLTAIRAVVEAAISDALGNTPNPTQNDDEAEDILAALDSALTEG